MSDASESDPARKRFLTMEELARRWGLHKTTLYPWVQEGRLPFATKLGGVWRFPIKAVEAYEKKQTVGGG